MQKGYALSIVLWIVAAMGAIALFLSSLAKDRIHIAQGIDNKIKATLKAQESLDLMLFYGSTGKFYINQMLNAQLEDLNIPNALYIDGRTVVLNESNVTLTDGGALCNLLFPYGESIGKELGEESVFKESLYDWIDEDTFLQLNGAEDDYYSQISDNGYESRDKQAIQDVAELGLIKGIDKQKLAPIKKNFLYTWAIRINLTTATDEKLYTLLDLPKETIEELLMLRQTDMMQFITKVNLINSNNETFFELYGFVPSKSLRVEISSKVGNAHAKINATIELHYKNKERWVYKFTVE